MGQVPQFHGLRIAVFLVLKVFEQIPAFPSAGDDVSERVGVVGSHSVFGPQHSEIRVCRESSQAFMPLIPVVVEVLERCLTAEYVIDESHRGTFLPGSAGLQGQEGPEPISASSAAAWGGQRIQDFSQREQVE